MGNEKAEVKVKVKILETFQLGKTGQIFKQGDETEVPKYLADRHTDTGFLELIDSKLVKKEK